MRYPFPLSDGVLCELDLPQNGLTEDEAVRLRQFIDALVIEPPTSQETDRGD
jgi:hypothetical protein